MKYLIIGLFSLLATFCVSANEDPEAAVEPLKIARDTFYTDVSLFRKGQLTKDELVQRISDQFAPIINDRKVALRVMGKYARQASAGERAQFTKQLEGSLVDAYARGLASYGGEKLSLPEKAIVLKPGRAVLEAKLKSPGKDDLPIQFAMGYDKQRGWLVENVVVAGINLGLTLRNQFAELVKTNGNIAGAIDAWSLVAVSDK